MANANFFSPDGGITRYLLEDTEGRIMYADDIDGINLLDVSKTKDFNTIGTWSNNVYTVRGVTYTILDGTITINGTASGGNAELRLLQGDDLSAFLNNYNDEELVIYDGTGASVDNLALAVRYTDEGITKYLVPSERMVLPKTSDLIFITINNGQTASNMVLKPAICKREFQDSIPRPYNQQSIQHQINDINESGAVNRLNITATTSTSNGVIMTVNKDSDSSVTSIVFNGTPATGSYVNFKLSENIPVSKARNTKLSTGVATGTISQFNLEAVYRTDNGTYISEQQVASGEIELIIPSNAATVEVWVQIKSGYTANNLTMYPMLAPLSYTGPYVPYAMTNRELTNRVDDLEYIKDDDASVLTNVNTSISMVMTDRNDRIKRKGYLVSFVFEFIVNTEIPSARVVPLFTVPSDYIPLVWTKPIIYDPDGVLKPCASSLRTDDGRCYALNTSFATGKYSITATYIAKNDLS